MNTFYSSRAINQRAYHVFQDKFFITTKMSNKSCRDVEAKLEQLDKVLKKEFHSEVSLLGYKRQYTGIRTVTRSYIYINLILWDDNEWIDNPIFVCDGGSGFCGLILDAKTLEIVDFACNGEA